MATILCTPWASLYDVVCEVWVKTDCVELILETETGKFAKMIQAKAV